MPTASYRINLQVSLLEPDQEPDFFLLELPSSDILSSLGSCSIVGEDDADAVFVTDSTSHRLKKVLMTNIFLVASSVDGGPCAVQSIFDCYYECSPSYPLFERVPLLLQNSVYPWSGPSPEWARILQVAVQCSAREIESGLLKYNAFEFTEGASEPAWCRVFDSSYLFSFLKYLAAFFAISKEQNNMLEISGVKERFAEVRDVFPSPIVPSLCLVFDKRKGAISLEKYSAENVFEPNYDYMLRFAGEMTLKGKSVASWDNRRGAPLMNSRASLNRYFWT